MFRDENMGGNLMAFNVLRNVIGHGPNGYTQDQYEAIIEYLNEVFNFKECWENIWSSTRLRFGVKPSDLAINYTLPILKKIKGRVLWDLGAGTGRDSIFFSKYCDDVTSVELTKTAANDIGQQILNKNIRNIEVINDDVWSALKRQNNIKKGFVDVIHAHSFLHYTKPTMTDVIFSEIHQLLRKGGRIVFGVKGKGDHLYGKGEEIEKDVWVFEDGQRRKFYDEESISEVLYKAGFEIELLETEKEVFDNKISEFVIGVARKG
jgi:SAM-dependent methyltransferase